MKFAYISHNISVQQQETSVGTKYVTMKVTLFIFIASFILKCVSKKLPIRILKRDNQLHLFRRLEQCNEKQVNCETAIEFLKLCQNFNLTPTFAKIEQTKASKWKRSANAFEENVVAKELSLKRKQLTVLKYET